MSIVTDATVIMKRAEEVIGDLMAVNARLQSVRIATMQALSDIILEADQSNGGEGAQLPTIVLHIREIAGAALFIATVNPDEL